MAGRRRATTTAISTATKATTATTRNSTATATGNDPVLTRMKIKPKPAPITEPDLADDMGRVCPLASLTFRTSRAGYFGDYVS